MTQPIPSEETAIPAGEESSPIFRVRVLSSPFPLQYELGKLWPQGPEQRKVAELSFEMYRLQAVLGGQKRSEQNRVQFDKDIAEYRAKRVQCKEMRKALEKSEPAVECTVGKIMEVVDNGQAMVLIIGDPFGDWAEKGNAAVDKLPASGCVVTQRFTAEDLQAYYEGLMSDEDDDEDEADEEEDASDVVALTEEHVAVLNAAMMLVGVAQPHDESGQGGVLIDAETFERLRASIDVLAADELGEEQGGETEVE